MRINWKDYFMTYAAAASLRSTCVRRKYGAIIVKDNRIVSSGYNGSCRGDDNCCDLGYCVREKMNIPHGERYELCRAVHAEMNAIINGIPSSMKDAELYIYGEDLDGNVVNAAPCQMCQRVIANAQIRQVHYMTKDGIVSYFVNASDTNYYRIYLSFGPDLPARQILVDAPNESVAKKKVYDMIQIKERSLFTYIQRWIDTNVPEDERKAVDTRVTVLITNIVPISKTEYESSETWVIPEI